MTDIFFSPSPKNFPGRWIFSFFLLLTICNACKKEEDPAPAPIELEVTFTNSQANLSVNSVFLSAKVTKTTGVTEEAGFMFGEESNPSTKYAGSLSSGDLISKTINNLQFDKQYYFKAYAIINGQEFTGEIKSFPTGKVTYMISPLTAGPGQIVKIEGNFLTSTQSDIALTIGSMQITLSSFSSTLMEFVVPDNAVIGSSNSITLSIRGTNIPVAEKLTISNWSVMRTVPTDFFRQSFFTYRSSAEFNVNGKILYFDGSSMSAYDKATDSWNYIPTPKPTPGPNIISDPVYFNFQNKAYFGLGSVFPTTAVYELNSTATQWTTKGSFPGSISTYRGVFTNSAAKGYYGLGFGSNKEINREFWEYDPSIDQWTRLPDYPGRPFAYGAAFVIDDYVFVGGGADYSSGGGPETNTDFYAYNVTSGSWTKLADFPSVLRPYAISFKQNGYVFTAHGEIWVYDMQANSWTSKGKVPNTGSGRNIPQFWVTNEYILIGGGTKSTNPFTAYNDVYRWYPD